jgi:hypothetical protein
MPTKVRDRSTVSRLAGGLLADGQARQKVSLRKAPPLGVSKTALLSPGVLMGG